ncbi:MAG: tetratricopeptide repeat protein, partial [Kiritimatiellae bacterium]|nr:tetratricopeptide repeat protein [Kiritimatiellia bacterium]
APAPGASPAPGSSQPSSAARAPAPHARPTSHWTRPVAVAKASSVRSWLLLIALVCLFVALWPPLKRFYWRIHNRPINETVASVSRSEFGFLAISYEGVSANPEPSGNFITTERFAQHLAALRDAGYHPISLADIRDFYVDGRPLPEKAILMTFENTHRSTYFEIRNLLNRNRWRATMGVVTKPVLEGNSDVLLTPYLRDMLLDSSWDLACESHDGTSTIPTSPHGRRGLFFSAPQWLANQQRYEHYDEFQARIVADHDTALSFFRDQLKLEPTAFFFPKGNYGQFEDNSSVLRDANLNAVSSHYILGFILNQHAYNDAHTDRRRLNRLPIDPNWDADTLLRRLENSWPLQAGRSRAQSIVPPERWIADWGVLDPYRSSFTLRARPADDPYRTDADATGGARAWIAGSSSFFDGAFDTRFRLVRGDFTVYLRFRADDDWIRLSLSDAGRATLSASAPGGDPQTLASEALEEVSDFRTTHQLLVALRDNLLFARLDGQPLFSGPILLPPASPDASGFIGIGIWAPPPGLAQVDILDCHLRSRFDAAVTWPPALSRDPLFLAQALNEQAFRYSLIAPPWVDVYSASPIAFPQVDAQAFGIIAAANHSPIFPSIRLHDTLSLSSIDLRDLVRRLLDQHADGAFVDASAFPADALPKLKDWLSLLHRSFEPEHLRIAVRFPLAASSHVAISTIADAIPDLLVVDDDGDVPPGVSPSRVYSLLLLDPPATDEDLSLFFQLADYQNVPADPDDPSSLRQEGLRKYAAGNYEDAAAAWTRWKDAEPRSAEAWAFLGNAYTRLNHNEAAIDAYRHSLDLEPGQISLFLQLCALLEGVGHANEAAELLDTYARAFPDNADITMAQARWLAKHGTRPAGRELLTNILERDPANIQVRLALQDLLDDPLERYANMHELLDLGTSNPSQVLGFGNDIASAELLTIAESSVFFDFIRDTATNSPREAIRSLYSSFLPLRAPIVEEFNASALSGNWIAFGTPLTTIAGAYDLRAAADMSEAYLRLRHSELLRDGFVEVTLGESVGAFWLYARRSSQSMIRFGFDGDGFLRIQTWKNGEIRTGESRAWIRPPGDITLRLEVRGDGAIGLVDGKRVFSTPLHVPQEIAYGWWSVAPFSPELGIARARIERISAGPLPPAIALLRETDPDLIDDALQALRPNIERLSAIAPVLFAQQPDGTIPVTPLADLMPFRMFCAYHRLRLIPVVALDFYSDIQPSTLVNLILTHHLSGLILLSRTLPSEAWFDQVASLLEKTTADLIVVQSQDALWGDKAPRPAKPVVLREIQRGSLLIQPSADQWRLRPRIYPVQLPTQSSDFLNPLLLVLPAHDDPPLPDNFPADPDAISADDQPDDQPATRTRTRRPRKNKPKNKKQAGEPAPDAPPAEALVPEDVDDDDAQPTDTSSADTPPADTNAPSATPAPNADDDVTADDVTIDAADDAANADEVPDATPADNDAPGTTPADNDSPTPTPVDDDAPVG